MRVAAELEGRGEGCGDFGVRDGQLLQQQTGGGFGEAVQRVVADHQREVSMAFQKSEFLLFTSNFATS